MKKHLALVLAALALAFVAGRVTAEAAGDPAPLVFYGVLEDAGVISTAPNAVIALSIWKDGASNDTSQRLCEVRPSSPTPLDHGRFELTLGGDCVTAIRKAPGAVYAQVEVGGLPLGRAVLGSVPNAERAAVAGEVDWAGVKGVGGSTPWPGSVASANVQGLEARLAAIEDRLTTGGKYAALGRYCGQTAAMKGDARYYSGAKALCETACSSPMAHLCSGEELVRTAATDTTERRGWIATGSSSVATGDCQGFTTAATGQFGTSWEAFFPLQRGCDSTLAYLCCN